MASKHFHEILTVTVDVSLFFLGILAMASPASLIASF